MFCYCKKLIKITNTMNVKFVVIDHITCGVCVQRNVRVGVGVG